MPTRAPATPLAAFDWTLIRSFVAVLDAGSLTGAARRLKMHQPTLSRHVAELEAQLGVPLFERTGRGVTPTAAALAIADAARAMEQGAGALSQALAGARSATSGTVRISCSDVAATWLVPDALVSLQRAEPEIRIELVASNAISNLLRRDADIAVRMLRPEQGSLIARKLGDADIVACAHGSYLARAGVPQRPDDLLRHRLIGYDSDDTIVQGFAKMGLPVTREHFALRTDDQVAYAQLVARGAGIGFLTRYVLPFLPGVQPLLPTLKVPPLPVWLVVHREIRGRAVVRKVYDHLAEAIPQVLRGA